MRAFATSTAARRCRCGALCEAAKTHCRKCHYRSRWYRRKAWKFNPMCHLPQNLQERSDAA